MTPEQAADLEVARALVRAGVPVFLGTPDDSRPTGYALPPGWERSVPDESVVDAWAPGMALCAVTGHALDLIDLDPRSGGELPTVASVPHLGRAATPSGGTHLFVAPLGVESRDGAWPGVDVKSGTPEGRGRGFAFIAPTVRVAKAGPSVGLPAPYRWVMVPLGGSVRDAAHVAHTTGVYNGLAEVRQRVVDLRAARGEQGQPRRLARSAAAREWGRARERLTEDVRRWAAAGWGGEAHAGLLEASKHLVLLSPEHAEEGYRSAFRQAGVEPDEADLAKLDSALDKYGDRPDVVVPDEQLGADEGFWLGAAPPPFGGPDPAPAPAAPPGTFDLVTPERARRRAAPPRASYGAFGGTRALFYAEGVHWLQGESESGKSWVAQAVALDVLRAGGLVLYVDHEDREARVLERLDQLGVSDEEFGRLCYVGAADVPHAALTAHLAETDRDYACLVVDGVTSALTAAGLSGRDEQELTAWVDALPRRARMALCVDHVVKAVDERRGMAVGTQAKKSVVTGASYEVTCAEKFARGTTGELWLVIQKDKPGGVRADVPARGVRLRFGSDPETGAVTITVPSAMPASERVAAIEDRHAASVMALVTRLEEASGVLPSDKHGAQKRAFTKLADLSGSAGDRNLHGDAWRTFLARAGVPGAVAPEYVRRHLQDHQDDQQDVAGLLGLTVFTPGLTSQQTDQGDQQDVWQDAREGDQQGGRTNGLHTADEQAI